MDLRNEENITVFEHPLIQHKISLLRDKKTGTNEFRKLVEEIAMLEGFEALSDSYRGKKGDDSRTQYGSRTSLVDAAG